MSLERNRSGGIAKGYYDKSINNEENIHFPFYIIAF